MIFFQQPASSSSRSRRSSSRNTSEQHQEIIKGESCKRRPPRHFDQLLQILDKMGHPSDTKRYLFLGGYVDRGPRSLDTVSLLFFFKAEYSTLFVPFSFIQLPMAKQMCTIFVKISPQRHSNTYFLHMSIQYEVLDSTHSSKATASLCS